MNERSKRAKPAETDNVQQFKTHTQPCIVYDASIYAAENG